MAAIKSQREYVLDVLNALKVAVIAADEIEWRFENALPEEFWGGIISAREAAERLLSKIDAKEDLQ